MVYQAIYLLFSNPRDGLKDSLLQMNGGKLEQHKNEIKTTSRQKMLTLIYAVACADVCG